MKTVSIEWIRKHFSYNPETGIVTRLSDNRVMNQIGDRGYLIVNWGKQIWKVHRIAWALYHGEWATGDIDHIDRIKKNNRISNLREVSRGLNVFNSSLRSDNTSGHTGVTWDKARNKWMVRIDRKLIGRYTSFEEAVKIRSQLTEGISHSIGGSTQ